MKKKVKKICKKGKLYLHSANLETTDDEECHNSIWICLKDIEISEEWKYRYIFREKTKGCFKKIICSEYCKECSGPMGCVSGPFSYVFPSDDYFGTEL